jgi:type VI secretion system protein ImpA
MYARKSIPPQKFACLRITFSLGLCRREAEWLRAGQVILGVGYLVFGTTMSSQPLLDFDALVAPIPGDNPAGTRDLSLVRTQLDELRKEINPDAYAKNDPQRPEAAKKADWKGIIKLTQDVLHSTTKDYLIATRLTEALVKDRGFPGLTAGLRLLRLLTEQCWDRMHPEITEEDDIDTRARRFDWLDDADRGAWFPSTLRLVPMMPPGPEGYGWQHWKDAQEKKSGITGVDIEKAIQTCSRDACESLVEDLNQSWQELELLSQALNAKMKTEAKNYAPGLTGIRGALVDCRTLAQQILQKKGGPKKGPEPAAASTPDAEAGAAGSAEPKMETRAEIYARVAEAAAKLQQIEPHSPIPYLLNRAVELGSLSFPDLMKSLILNPDVLKLMNRELGIKEPPEKK